MKPTYEELEARLRDSEARLRDSEARLRDNEARLQRTEFLLKVALEEIAKLKEQLGRNSKNSSKPPSSDPKGNTPGAKPKPSNRFTVFYNFEIIFLRQLCECWNEIL